MKVYDLDRKNIGSAADFFKEYSSNITKFDTGLHTKSIDGTGVDASVDKYTAERIVGYINKKFKYTDTATYLDAGAGLGYLQAEMMDAGLDSYSIEGASDVAKMAICDKDRYAIVDLCKTITDQRLKKAFHLSTSFELIEHIHPNEEEVFWNNIIYMSHYHLCSIHIDGCERIVNEKLLVGPDISATAHCNLKTMSMWRSYFDSRNISYEILGMWPKGDIKDDEFRRETRFTRYNGWSSSSFWLLDFVDANYCFKDASHSRVRYL